MTVINFPQHIATELNAKPSIRKIIERATSPAGAMQVIERTYPDMTIEKVLEEMATHIKKLEREAISLQGTVDALEPFNKQINEMMVGGLSFQRSIEKLADGGDEFAQKVKADLFGPAQQEFCRLIDLAADLDPYWHPVTDTNGQTGHRVDEGALYDTPEELVQAYCKQQDIAYPL